MSDTTHDTSEFIKALFIILATGIWFFAVVTIVNINLNVYLKVLLIYVMMEIYIGFRYSIKKYEYHSNSQPIPEEDVIPVYSAEYYCHNCGEHSRFTYRHGQSAEEWRKCIFCGVEKAHLIY